MLQRLIEFRVVIDDVIRHSPQLFNLHLELDDHDLGWIQKLVPLLELFDKPTTRMSGQSYPTLCMQYLMYVRTTFKGTWYAGRRVSF